MFADTNNMQTLSTREERGKAIADMDGQIKRIDGFYDVKSTEIDLSAPGNFFMYPITQSQSPSIPLQL